MGNQIMDLINQLVGQKQAGPTPTPAPMKVQGLENYDLEKNPKHFEVVHLDKTPPTMPVKEPKAPPTVPHKYKFKYQEITDKVAQQTGFTEDDFNLLRAGENKAENPEAINDNWNKNHTQIVSKDVGLYQVSVPLYDRNGNPNPNADAEIERLKDPEYNTKKAAEIWHQRVNLLQDPVLAIASYNMGAGGAVLDPEDAIKRAQWVYSNAGVPMPQTEFTKDPHGYVKKRMDYYRSKGLFT